MAAEHRDQSTFEQEEYHHGWVKWGEVLSTRFSMGSSAPIVEALLSATKSGNALSSGSARRATEEQNLILSVHLILLGSARSTSNQSDTSVWGDALFCFRNRLNGSVSRAKPNHVNL